jgi:hypothetical protein
MWWHYFNLNSRYLNRRSTIVSKSKSSVSRCRYCSYYSSCSRRTASKCNKFYHRSQYGTAASITYGEARSYYSKTIVLVT